MRRRSLTLLLLTLGACSFDTRFEGESLADGGLADAAETGMWHDASLDADDAGTDAPLPTFKDDFEREDDVLSTPWRDTGLDTVSLWRGQLCLQETQGVTLELPPGPYGYVRFDITGGDNLTLALEGSAETLAVLQWRIHRDHTRSVEALTGEDVGPYTSARPRTLEMLIDYEARVAKVRLAASAWKEVSFQSALVSDLKRLRFHREQPLEPRPMDVSVCLDNVYVSERTPEGDPFLDSPKARAGRPTEDPREFCLFDRCGELAGTCIEQEDWEAAFSSWDPDIACSFCELERGLQETLLGLATDPSGAPLQYAARLGDGASKTLRDLVQCASEQCASDITTTPKPLQYDFLGDPTPWRDPPFALDVLLLDGRRLERASAFVHSGTLYLSQDKVSLEGFLPSTELRLYSALSEGIHMIVAREEGGALRIYFDAGYFLGWRELRFGMPVLSVDVPNIHRSLWVETAKEGDNLRRTYQVVVPGYEDWATAYRVTFPSTQLERLVRHDGSHTSHYYWVNELPQGPTVVSSAGFTRELRDGVDGAWHTLATFKDSVVFEHESTGARRWLPFGDRAVSSQFPEGQMRGTYLVNGAEVWATGGDDILRVGAFPASLDEQVDVPVASDAELVLYQTRSAFRLYDTNGAERGAYTPAAIELGAGQLGTALPSRAMPWGPRCGLLLSTRQTNGGSFTAIDLYAVDELGELSVERLDVLDKSPAQVRITAHPEGAFAWAHDQAIVGYDCREKKGSTIQTGKQIVALAEYPAVPSHFTPEPLPPPPEEEEW